MQSLRSEEPKPRLARHRKVVRASSLVLAFGLAPAALALTPRPGQPVVVLTLIPDAPVPHAIAESGASILWVSAKGHVAVLHADRQDLAADLRRKGVYLVAAAGPLGGCLPSLPLPATLTAPSQP